MNQTETSRWEIYEPDHRGLGGDGGGRQHEDTTFRGSVPRVLTALGGLVTALATAAAVYFRGVKGDGKETRPSSEPVSPRPRLSSSRSRRHHRPAASNCREGRRVRRECCPSKRAVSSRATRSSPGG